MLTRKEIISKSKIKSTAYYIKGCNGFVDDFGNVDTIIGSDSNLSVIVKHVQENYPDITFEIVPLEYKENFQPKELTKILIIEDFF